MPSIGSRTCRSWAEGFEAVAEEIRGIGQRDRTERALRRRRRGQPGGADRRRPRARTDAAHPRPVGAAARVARTRATRAPEVARRATIGSRSPISRTVPSRLAALPRVAERERRSRGRPRGRTLRGARRNLRWTHLALGIVPPSPARRSRSEAQSSARTGPRSPTRDRGRATPPCGRSSGPTTSSRRADLAGIPSVTARSSPSRTMARSSSRGARAARRSPCVFAPIMRA